MARQIQMGQQPPSEKPPARTGRRARGAPPPPPEPPPPPAANETASKLVTFQPPQGPGVPQRPFATGGPDTGEKPSVTLRVLRDPVARMSFSRVYSGQSRNWTR